MATQNQTIRSILDSPEYTEHVWHQPQESFYRGLEVDIHGHEYVRTPIGITLIQDNGLNKSHRKPLGDLSNITNDGEEDDDENNMDNQQDENDRVYPPVPVRRPRWHNRPTVIGNQRMAPESYSRGRNYHPLLRPRLINDADENFQTPDFWHMDRDDPTNRWTMVQIDTDDGDAAGHVLAQRNTLVSLLSKVDAKLDECGEDVDRESLRFDIRLAIRTCNEIMHGSVDRTTWAFNDSLVGKVFQYLKTLFLGQDAEDHDLSDLTAEMMNEDREEQVAAAEM
ncbi:hypothetical protein B0T17DRAFT_518306 [Bombardia bombarda]|uniref:Uncharacterized protein n=1 Tax=Bombardia bombarda TaxID=252184 RepID=A0AA39XM69_9PEZI|nr:hypothetical protein B0T17DRAFT_518306 [Bombardia bombarda]